MGFDFSKLVKDIIKAYSNDVLDEHISVSIAQTLNDYFDSDGDFSEIEKPYDLTEEELIFSAAILSQLIAFWKFRNKEAIMPSWLSSIPAFKETRYLVPKKYRKLAQKKISETCLKFNVIASKGFLTFA